MTWRFFVVWMLSAGLLLSQAVGVLHQVAHTQLAPAGVSLPQTALTAAHETVGDNWLSELFGDHQKDSGDCRLFDQLAHADLLPTVSAVALPMVLPALVLLILEGEAVARWASLFDARAPPAFR